ncbi:MAG: S41 family peptidase, partial [Chloroflexi bacterium]|nr:S41 family peptidase [Chloroflexota bacterium]
VDGPSTDGLDLGAVVDLIKGPPGSDVLLEILRVGGIESVIVVVKRAVVPGPSLKSEMLEGDIAYIWLLRFHQETGNEFRRKLQSLIDDGARGLVLDMRENPGGSLSAATFIASEFLSDGIVLYEVSNSGKREDWPVQSGGIALDLPVVVIVNGHSASAAEVVAGALQSHDRARLYGSTTYGKGSVQTFRQLADGSALYLTVARWHTPDGREIQGLGIEPDIFVPWLVRSSGGGLLVDAALEVAYSDLVTEIESK